MSRLCALGGIRVIRFARTIIKNRSGYGLKPSKTNPRVKRWMRLQSDEPTRGRADFDPERLMRDYQQVMKDLGYYRKIHPTLAEAVVLGQGRLPYQDVAQLSRLQALAFASQGGADDLLGLIAQGATLAGQFGPDHLALIEHMSQSKEPLLTDTYDAVAGNDFADWAEHVERGVRRLGGTVLGAIPRTSAVVWDWNWGPPEDKGLRREVGDQTVMITPEATLLIAPPPDDPEGFAQEYFKRITKDQPLADKKAVVVEKRQAVWPDVAPYVKAGKKGSGREWRRYKAAMSQLKKLQQQEADFHEDAHRRGEKLAPVAWYEPDTRTNYAPDEDWAWGRIATTENGVHYISSDLHHPGPTIMVDPFIREYIQYSRVPQDDAYLSGQRKAYHFDPIMKP